MKIIAGIYRIVNLKNKKSYIGSSKNIIRRWYIHKSALKNNRHHCIYLQRSWNKHGAQTFKFEIIKELPFVSEEQLLAEELKVIGELLPEYNVGSVGGGDNLTNNPNRDDIIKRMTITLREQVSKMSDEERQSRWSRPGKTNPNWKGGRTFCKCGTRISSVNQTCSECRDRSGNHNPFYGKLHSNKAKEKIGNSNRGRRPANIRSVEIDGVVYPSVTIAAIKLGVCNATILFRIKSQYWDYKYITPQHPSLLQDVDRIQLV